MPTNNQEWWKKRFTVQPDKIEDLDLDCDEAFNHQEKGEVVLNILKDEADAFIRQEIRQAKIEGLEEAKDIVVRAKVGKPQQASDERIYDIKCMVLQELQSPLLESIKEAISNLRKQ